MTKGVNTRDIIVETLKEILEEGNFSHQVLSRVLEKYQYLEKQERSFISRSVEGVMEYLITLDYILDSYSKTPVGKMKPFIRNLLRMSVYHLFYMDSVPERAIVSEAVKMTEKKGFYGLKGFVNGLLRNIIRNKDAISWPEDAKKSLEVRYSIPGWMLEEWSKTLPEEEIRQLLEGFHESRPLNIRVNTLRTTPGECKKLLEKEGVSVSVHPYLSQCLEISGYDYLRKLSAFREGLFQVQDVSSMLAGSLAVAYLKELNGKVFLDMCSAPGGKALYVAERCPDVQVLARDVSPYKISLIEENARRSGAKNIKTEVFDATNADERQKEAVDVLLADLPCSGLGIMGKKRDIAYKTTRQDVKELAGLQRKMLERAAGYVKAGGILIFSTCTITGEENRDNRKWFLKEFPFEEENICSKMADCLQTETLKKGYLQLLPGKHACDGFFISVMRKKSRE